MIKSSLFNQFSNPNFSAFGAYGALTTLVTDIASLVVTEWHSHVASVSDLGIIVFKDNCHSHIVYTISVYCRQNLLFVGMPPAGH